MQIKIPPLHFNVNVSLLQIGLLGVETMQKLKDVESKQASRFLGALVMTSAIINTAFELNSFCLEICLLEKGKELSCNALKAWL